MLGFWKRGEQVNDLILRHLAHVRQAMSLCGDATRAYFVEKDVEKAKRLMVETHKAESLADDARREVERTLVQGALLAPSRRQLLSIVDGIDTLANAAQGTLHYLVNQSVDVPPEVTPFALRILEESETLFEDVDCGVRSLLSGDAKTSLDCAERIDRHESAVDRLDAEATRTLFALNIELARKMHVRGYFAVLALISDRAEDLADQVALVAAERAL
jgi:predicted phosphate transport protein (TIGR00153 family)